MYPRFFTNRTDDMNAIEKDGNRHLQFGALKQKFASLTENDQLFMEGLLQSMFGKRQIRLGKTKEELKKILGSL